MTTIEVVTDKTEYLEIELSKVLDGVWRLSFREVVYRGFGGQTTLRRAEDRFRVIVCKPSFLENHTTHDSA